MCYLGSIVARPKLKGIGGGVLQRVTRTVRHKISRTTQKFEIISEPQLHEHDLRHAIQEEVVGN